MLWKQRDTSDPLNTVVYREGPVYGFDGLFSTVDTLYKRAYAGVNEAGFGIMNNLSYNLRPDSVGFVTFAGRLMTEALGTCGSVAEFQRLLDGKEHPMGLSTNFGVIDAFGEAAYFEVSDTGYVRFDVPAGGILYRTNYSLSGDEGRGRGHVRYDTMGELTAGRSRFDAAFFMKAGRTFSNPLVGNALCGRGAFFYDHDFIPRPTTTSSVVIEGVLPGERPDGSVMWCATGYTPCCYAVPVWVAAKDRLPSFLIAASERAELRKQTLHKEKYLDRKALRSMLRAVRRAERKELRAGRKLEKAFRRDSLDIAAVEAYNRAAAARFERFNP